jgi:hypothetical protein
MTTELNGSWGAQAFGVAELVRVRVLKFHNSSYQYLAD